MRTVKITRRTRTAMALLAGAALLGLGACGTGTEDGAEESSAPPSASTDDGAQETEQDADHDQASDDGGSATGDDDEVTEDDEGASTAGERTRIMLRTDLGLDGSTGEGALVLTGDDLSALLAEPFGGTADCDAELVLEPGAAPVDCVGPANFDSTEPTQPWVAHTVMVPAESGFQDGSRVAVLFSTGTALPEAAEDLLDEDVTLTGVGFGSTFGMDPLSAEDVAGSTLGTLTSEFAYVPVDEMADWSDVTCEDGLDFAEFETVDCEATTAEGESWDLVVAPGTYADNDQGLLVGIDRTSGS
ncbi:hypothetical protein CFK39_04735 [Brachybacterium avium]|uniref:Uncharacterized protein n=1 Tax=Brachybacterium avium TaxID=2017485 RepID=A0A220UB12_9MICO|nr:hypothetical protein CFK39_04735 [Brachybacterium avium]